ncbi:P-loop containing nucleoside triphosphate hydrolase protein [Echria macrotheca]|uniref:P-loop containing nucleoside triphosphate hydrolase protein n=1 Tax=Echria macrotheca TaxID=438768 RepID=A0AAJ0BAB2_9PEZI|nr:P-loop containing nucleoside triphosphate hydrolase protein [Echria macrotheca]
MAGNGDSTQNIKAGPFDSTTFTLKRPHFPQDGQNDVRDDMERPHKLQKKQPSSPLSSGSLDFDDVDENQVDWRESLRQALHLPDDTDDAVLETALERISSLLAPERPTPRPRPKPTFIILHKVECQRPFEMDKVYTDEPVFVSTDATEFGHLAGRNEITDVMRYIERTPAICLTAVRIYRCCYHPSQNADPLRRPSADDEAMLISEPLCQAIAAFEAHIIPRGEAPIWSKIKPNQEVHNFYYWLYPRLSSLASFARQRAGEDQEELNCFLSYVQQSKVDEYKEVTRLLGEGKMTRKFFKYLYIPGDILIVPQTDDKDLDRCYKLRAWPDFTYGTELHPAPGRRRMDVTNAIHWNGKLNLFSWGFDGRVKTEVFSRHMSFPWSQHSEGIATTITSLSIYPFAAATPERQNSLRARGMMFWGCRGISNMQYSGWDIPVREHYTCARFMIDHSTWNQVQKHRRPVDVDEAREKPHQSAQGNQREDTTPTYEYAEIETPPDNDFFLLLPVAIPAFDLQDKVWRILAVARLKPVQWDQTAFERLVLEQDTKDVIKALVTHKVKNTVSTDLIRGKGSGLILLFHGPPGTGKTLTAESVAEEAKKPLYRVTCGDIGTAPDVVERNLKGVLTLCKNWDCVVLLDEAEVFLQERSLTDLNRNALVSVFLRTLEYYDGIMILTSNRVATFDEGFKSRIQLSLHYPKLSQKSRRLVWQNFFDRLDSDPIASAELDIDDLRRNADRLSRFELNGREIRNAINVARPLARAAEDSRLDSECLIKVVKVQRRFDEYLKEVYEGLGDEEVAREEGRR